MQNNLFWQHYCKVEKDIMTFEKGVECDWCGENEVTAQPLTKTVQGVEDWLTSDAPLLTGQSITSDTVTLNSGFTIPMDTGKKSWQQNMIYNVPVDIMHKWYPDKMKGITDDDFSF